MAAFMGHAILVSTSVVAGQVIYSYTATASLNMKLLVLGAAYTSYSATEAYLGFGRFQIDYNGGMGWETKIRSPAFVNTDLDNNNPLIIRPLGSGQVLATGQSIKGICTPSTATSIRWSACVWGELS